MSHARASDEFGLRQSNCLSLRIALQHTKVLPVTAEPHCDALETYVSRYTTIAEFDK